MIEDVYKAAANRYDSGMEYARAGRSGILLPRVSLGFWHNFGELAPLSRSKEIMHAAFDHGITSFDLANNYGPRYGTAEETFGQVFRRSFAPYRDEMFIATKAGYEMWPGPYGNWGSRKYLITSLNQSLRRMGLDYVDVFYSHRYDPDTPEEETLQALVDIVKQGKALYAGISRWPLEASRRAFAYLREHDVPCLLFQDRLNIIENSGGERRSRGGIPGRMRLRVILATGARDTHKPLPRRHTGRLPRCNQLLTQNLKHKLRGG